MDPAPEPAKPLWKSKTFWTNIAMIVGAIADGQFGPLIPAPVAVPIVAGVNILLRLVTHRPVTLDKEP